MTSSFVCYWLNVCHLSISQIVICITVSLVIVEYEYVLISVRL